MYAIVETGDGMLSRNGSSAIAAVLAIFAIAVCSKTTAASLHYLAAAAQSTACVPPPPEWGVTKRFAKWTVNRVCESGLNILSVGAAPEAGAAGGFAFLCDPEFGVSGTLALSKIQLDGPVSLLTLKGSAAPAVPLDGYGAGGTTGLNLEESPATSRFMAALVDGPGPTFTLVITPPGKPLLEMTFSRNGLAAAVKPLRRECAW